MAWPNSQDYNEAVHTPDQWFSDPVLKRGEAITNDMGLPLGNVDRGKAVF